MTHTALTIFMQLLFLLNHFCNLKLWCFIEKSVGIISYTYRAYWAERLILCKGLIFLLRRADLFVYHIHSSDVHAFNTCRLPQGTKVRRIERKRKNRRTILNPHLYSQKKTLKNFSRTTISRKHCIFPFYLFIIHKGAPKIL